MNIHRCGEERCDWRRSGRKQQSSDDGTGTLSLRSTPRPDDAADALAVAICRTYTGQLNKFKAVGGYQ